MPRRENHAVSTIRRMLAGALSVGSVGSAAELMLLGHFGTASQLIPLVLLTMGVLLLGWQIARPTEASVRALQAMMLLFVLSALVGIGLHYDANVALELETNSSLGGMRLVWQALTGAAPVLAPGTMALLGFIGLVYTYGHPSLEISIGTRSSKDAVE